MRRFTPMWTLRQREQEIDLPEGEYVIGRSEGCDLVLDDPLVSRRHAAVEVVDDAVTLRDLGSRNGIYLHYRIVLPGEAAALSHGDLFTIGSHNFVLMRSATKRDRKLATLREEDEPFFDEGKLENTAVGLSYAALITRAENAFAQGRMDVYAQSIHLLLEALRRAIHQGWPVDDIALHAAGRHAIRVAELRGSDWVEQLVSLYAMGPYPMPLAVVGTLERLIRTRGWTLIELAPYVAAIEPFLHAGGPHERELLHRLKNLVELPLPP